MSAEKQVLVTRTYTVRKAPGRTVTVDNVPAFEVTVGDETSLQFTFEVADSVQQCIDRALTQCTDADVRIEYEASARLFVRPRTGSPNTPYGEAGHIDGQSNSDII
jgi:hypothetical protein